MSRVAIFSIEHAQLHAHGVLVLCDVEMCAGNVTKMADERNRWLFTKEQLQDTPSRADGVDPKKELSYRQQAASLIFDIGQKLNV